jgi:hypothetical protein
MDAARKRQFDAITNICLPVLTIACTALTALKLPQWGLAVNLVAQVFWLYSAYRAWKDANQVGIFITSVVMTVIIAAGVVNYWLL